MITTEKINSYEKRLGEARGWLSKLQSIERIDGMLKDGHYLISVSDATSTLLNNPQHLSLLLTDQERSVLEKSIQVALGFARARIEKELEKYDDLDD